MPFTGQDILNDSEAYIGDSLDKSHAITAINEALSVLGWRAMAFMESPIAADSGQWYALPAGLIAVREVRTADGLLYVGWREMGGKIAFQLAGTYTIIGTRLPTPLQPASELEADLDAALSEDIEAHDAFRPALTHYVQGWFKLQDDDESTDGKRLLSQAEAEFQRTYVLLLRGRRGASQWKVE